MRRPLWLAAALATGCERDPSLFGIWDLDTATVDGVRRTDAGLFEIDDDGELHLLLRYRWAGGSFAPDPDPELISGDTSTTENEDVFDNYAKDGEVHTVYLDPFGGLFRVAEYGGGRARLVAPTARWPKPLFETPDEPVHEIVLEISR